MCIPFLLQYDLHDVQVRKMENIAQQINGADDVTKQTRESDDAHLLQPTATSEVLF